MVIVLTPAAGYIIGVLSLYTAVGFLVIRLVHNLDVMPKRIWTPEALSSTTSIATQAAAQSAAGRLPALLRHLHLFRLPRHPRRLP